MKPNQITKTTEAVTSLAEFAPLRADMAEGQIAEVIKENLGGADMTPFDLERVTIPTGGGNKWTVPGLAGDEQVDHIDGIIVSFQDVRAYWQSADTAGDSPNCWSSDCKTGIGEPGGSCRACPMAQFGSAKDGAGAGQACKQIRRIFLLKKGNVLPILISLPPTSLKACRQYLTRVTNAGVPYWSILTRIALGKSKTQTGIAYSVAEFSAVTDEAGDLVILPADASAKVKAYAQAIRSVMTSRAVDEGDFVVGQKIDETPKTPEGPQE